MMSRAGAFNPASSTAAARPDKGASIARWRPVVAQCTAAVGVSAAMPLASRRPTTFASRATPMYTTSVPGKCANAAVVKHQIRVGQTLDGAQGEQAGIAGAGADEGNGMGRRGGFWNHATASRRGTGEVSLSYQAFNSEALSLASGVASAPRVLT